MEEREKYYYIYNILMWNTGEEEKTVERWGGVVRRWDLHRLHGASVGRGSNIGTPLQ
jgi:hypothetical protein